MTDTSSPAASTAPQTPPTLEGMADFPRTSDWVAEQNRRMYRAQIHAGMRPTYEAEWPYAPLSRTPQNVRNSLARCPWPMPEQPILSRREMLGHRVGPSGGFLTESKEIAKRRAAQKAQRAARRRNRP